MRRAFVVASLLLACTRVEGGAGPALAVVAGPQTAPEPLPEPQPQPHTRPPPAIARDDKAALAAAVKAAGGQFDGHDCGVWPPSFPGVIAVGSFAHDRGCDLSGLMIDGKWVTANHSVAGLQTVGFAAAASEAKQRLARAWVDEVEHAFGGDFVTDPDLAFKVAGVTHTPVVVRAEGPLIVVEGWVRHPAGMRYESAFSLETYRFAADGARTVASAQYFAVDGERLEAAEAAAKKK